jgi:hypothetical protein
MKNVLVLFAFLLLVGAAGAFAVTPVNIVYPIHGATYPITDPAPGALDSMYFTSSFSLTCGGGQHSVEWGFDTTTVGSATFYDMFSAQFVHKLPGGDHKFWVTSNCGNDVVKFRIGN